MAKIKVSVNKDICIGCGSCYASAPEIFAMDVDAKAKVIDSLNGIEISDEALIAKAKMARDLCPNQASTVEELPE
jgi:ferredoxin